MYVDCYVPIMYPIWIGIKILYSHKQILQIKMKCNEELLFTKKIMLIKFYYCNIVHVEKESHDKVKTKKDFENFENRI